MDILIVLTTKELHNFNEPLQVEKMLDKLYDEAKKIADKSGYELSEIADKMVSKGNRDAEDPVKVYTIVGARFHLLPPKEMKKLELVTTDPPTT